MQTKELTKEVSPISKKFLLIISSLIYVIVLIGLTSASQSNLGIVFLSLIPFLAHIAFFFFLLEEEHKLFKTIWILPVILSMLFYLVWYSGLNILNQIDGSTIFVLNIILSYIINAIFIIFYKKRSTISYKKHKDLRKNFHFLKQSYNERTAIQTDEIENLKIKLKNFEKQLNVTQENLSFNLRSIEDKCKSINFVIGRVYGKLHGGNERIRDSIKISSEWYNAFSELTQNFRKEDSARLYIILDNIHQKLKVLELKEVEVFDHISLSHLSLDREQNGRDRILDILATNDKDPVYDYHQESLEICQKLMDYLKNLE